MTARPRHGTLSRERHAVGQHALASPLAPALSGPSPAFAHRPGSVSRRHCFGHFPLLPPAGGRRESHHRERAQGPFHLTPSGRVLPSWGTAASSIGLPPTCPQAEGVPRACVCKKQPNHPRRPSATSSRPSSRSSPCHFRADCNLPSHPLRPPWRPWPWPRPLPFWPKSSSGSLLPVPASADPPRPSPQAPCPPHSCTVTVTNLLSSPAPPGLPLPAPAQTRLHRPHMPPPAPRSPFAESTNTEIGPPSTTRHLNASAPGGRHLGLWPYPLRAGGHCCDTASPCGQGVGHPSLHHCNYCRYGQLVAKGVGLFGCFFFFCFVFVQKSLTFFAKQIYI